MSLMSRPCSRCWWLRRQRWWHNRMLRTGWRAILATAATTPLSLRAASSPFQETFMSFAARGDTIVTWAMPLGIYWIHQFSLWVSEASIITVSISSELELCFSHFSHWCLIWNKKKYKHQNEQNKPIQTPYPYHTHRKSHPILSWTIS